MGKADKKLSALERLVQEAMGEGKSFGNGDDPAKGKWPELWRWLSTCYIGRDHVKQPATLSIRLGPEGVLVSLFDRDLAVSIDVTAGSLEDSFQALENALTGPHPPVKSFGRREPRVRKRRPSS
jgi:hypothetical protein